jgi:hypothetical protein
MTTFPGMTKRQDAAFDGPWNFCTTHCLSEGQNEYYYSAEQCAKECVARHHYVYGGVADDGSSDPSSHGRPGRPHRQAYFKCADRCLGTGSTDVGTIAACRQRCELL